MGLGYTFSMMGAITDDAMAKAQAQNSGGPKIDPGMMQNIMMGTMGCMFLVCLPITAFVWVNMWKGKKWAFITMLVLQILGLLGSMRNLSGPLMAFTVGSMILVLARIIYCSMRLAKSVGPPLS